MIYAKVTEERDDRILCVVSLDPDRTVKTWIHLDLAISG